MFSVEQHAGATVIRSHADIDPASFATLESLLLSAQRDERRVVVLIGADTSCSAAGLCMLARAQQRDGGKLVLVVPAGSRFAKTLAVTGFSNVLRTAPTLQGALRAGSAPAAPAGFERYANRFDAS